MVNDALFDEHMLAGNYSEAPERKLKLELLAASGVHFTNVLAKIVDQSGNLPESILYGLFKTFLDTFICEATFYDLSFMRFRSNEWTNCCLVRCIFVHEAIGMISSKREQEGLTCVDQGGAINTIWIPMIGFNNDFDDWRN